MTAKTDNEREIPTLIDVQSYIPSVDEEDALPVWKFAPPTFVPPTTWPQNAHSPLYNLVLINPPLAGGGAYNAPPPSDLSQ